MLEKQQKADQKAVENQRMTEGKQRSEDQKEANIQRKMEQVMENEKLKEETNDKTTAIKEHEEAEKDQADQSKEENCQCQNAGDGET